MPYTLKLVWCPSIKPYSISFILIAISWVAYIICLSQGIDYGTGVLTVLPETLRDFGAMNSELFREGQVWRLITASILHVDLLHITMNTLSILFFLTRLEKIYKPQYILALVLTSSITGKKYEKM